MMLSSNGTMESPCFNSMFSVATLLCGTGNRDPVMEVVVGKARSR